MTVVNQTLGITVLRKPSWGTIVILDAVSRVSAGIVVPGPILAGTLTGILSMKPCISEKVPGNWRKQADLRIQTPEMNVEKLMEQQMSLMRELMQMMNAQIVHLRNQMNTGDRLSTSNRRNSRGLLHFTRLLPNSKIAVRSMVGTSERSY